MLTKSVGDAVCGECNLGCSKSKRYSRCELDVQVPAMPNMMQLGVETGKRLEMACTKIAMIGKDCTMIDKTFPVMSTQPGLVLTIGGP